jgi:hypothetical protein
MLSGVSPTLSEDRMNSIGTAMKAFSVKQLQKMEEAGVRIWPFVKGLPPEYGVSSISDLDSPAEYNPQFRTIRVSPAGILCGRIWNSMRKDIVYFTGSPRLAKGGCCGWRLICSTSSKRRQKLNGLLTPDKEQLKKVLDDNEKGWRSY